MYTKVFRQIYDGTLADDWQALVTFQQLLILADSAGVVDMTIGAISRTTGIPMDVLEHGIRVLESPDPDSRSPDMEGRRIARLDDHRDWGWFLVNFKRYRELQSKEDKKEADRVRVAKAREAKKGNKNNGVADCRNLSHPVAECSGKSQTVADVAHTDTDTDVKDQKHLRGPAAQLPAEPAVIGIPLNDGSEHGVTAAEVTEFAELYPAVDVMAELRKMRGWSLANPAKRKTLRGVRKFVNGWLAKAQDAGGHRVAPNGLSAPPERRHRELT